tara:strand:+ start:3783 stop:4085 length:303 start_codon:yes stop_codon:yes gene_type:complete
MSKQYHDNLVEAVGSSFYYYTNHKDFDLTSAKLVDFENFANGWIKKYHGDWGIYNNSQPMACNTFKPCVDQLVYKVIAATESEIDRRVSEIVNEYLSNLK